MFTKAEFPECFPDNFVELLNREEERLEKEETDVYRVSKNGENNRDAFISTYEEYLNGEITDKDLDLEDVLINYSTSCNYKKARIKGILKMCLKRHPQAQMLTGKTAAECGPSQITRNRRAERKSDGHVDWWLYKDSRPQDFFEIFREEES